MATTSFELERTRELLCEKIVEILNSWPELHRRIFVQSHYRGESLDDISHCVGLKVSDARLILENCERKLRSALKSFRTGSVQDSSSPADSVRFVTSSCYRY